MPESKSGGASRVASRRPGIARPRGSPVGSIPAHRRPSFPGLPPGSRVLALGEVGGMPRPATHTEPGLALMSTIPEVCPPGEGIFCADRAAFADVAPLRERGSGL